VPLSSVQYRAGAKDYPSAALPPSSTGDDQAAIWIYEKDAAKIPIKHFLMEGVSSYWLG
jgi:hypothetical protein